MKVIVFFISLLFASFGFSQSNLKALHDNGDVILTVYPNPATDFINISLKGNNTDAFVKIYSALGTEVYSENIENFRKIDVSDFKNNVYIINVYSKDELLETARFVVRH
ncbi:MAG: T9SS type A sorting domain-containing protein [Crocinitomicaceae bacterium]|jgi:hypothetical protein